MQVKKEVPVEEAHFSRFFVGRAQPLGTFPAPNCLDISVVIGTIRNLEEGS